MFGQVTNSFKDLKGIPKVLLAEVANEQSQAKNNTKLYMFVLENQIIVT